MALPEPRGQLDLEVGGIELVPAGAGLLAPLLAEPGLQAQGGGAAHLGIEARHQVGAGEIGARLARGAQRAGMQVAAHAQVLACAIPIEAEARLAPASAAALRIRDVAGRRSGFVALAVYAHVGAVGQALAVAQHGAGVTLAGMRLCQPALGIGGAARDDVDDAVDGIGAPDGAAGAADHLDALDVGQDHVQGFPVDAGKQRRIDAAAVHQHQQLVGQLRGEAARADRIFLGAGEGHLQVRRQAQRFGDRGRARARDLGAANDIHRGRRAAEPPLLARDRGDHDIGQLLQGVVFQRKRIRAFLPQSGMPGRKPAACVQQKQCRTDAG